MSTHFVEITTTYEGDLRCRATHGPSRAELLTDPPVDNCGKGESFSPTDLVATALGTCMATLMGIFAQRHAIELLGMTLTVRKEMIQQPVRRIGKLTTEIRIPLPATHEHRPALERAALTCPVHQSLHPDIEKPVTFIWEA
jgi:putative redox protein